MKEMQVRKDDLGTYRIFNGESLSEALAPDSGEIIVRITQFAFTANNITYAAAGDMMGYWEFFPAHGNDVEGWGVIPVWGFAEVVASQHSDIAVGEKLYGYFPSATELKIKPNNIKAGQLTDASQHRAHLPMPYNVYKRIDADPAFNKNINAELSLLGPLYGTGFSLGEYLRENVWHGSEKILVLGASSKTSIGLGYALKQHSNVPPLVGLTSPSNQEFVKQLGLYDEVCNYKNLSTIENSKPTMIVDITGNKALLSELHNDLTDNMKFTLQVGFTHWDKAAADHPIIEERSEIFFQPTYRQQLVEQWGADEFLKKSNDFLFSSIKSSQRWLNLKRYKNLEDFTTAYPAICKGDLKPADGYIVEPPT